MRAEECTICKKENRKVKTTASFVHFRRWKCDAQKNRYGLHWSVIKILELSLRSLCSPLSFPSSFRRYLHSEDDLGCLSESQLTLIENLDISLDRMGNTRLIVKNTSANWYVNAAQLQDFGGCFFYFKDVSFQRGRLSWIVFFEEEEQFKRRPR